ncbi:hypothetical protein EJB05_39424, partial [Eragrostis curvula]
MVIPRALFSYFLLAILVLMERGEVRCYDLNRLEIHDDLLPFTQGLGFHSIAHVPAGGLQDGVADVVQAWYDDHSKEDIRLLHRWQPEDHVPLTRLLDLGIVALRLDAENHEHDENLTITRDQLPMDILDLTPDQPMLKMFIPEHLHTYDELRFCLEGSGYFDIRDEDDRWVRVSVKKGALIVVPAGIYHRFTLDTNNYFKVWFAQNPLLTRHSPGPALPSDAANRAPAPAATPRVAAAGPAPTPPRAPRTAAASSARRCREVLPRRRRDLLPPRARPAAAPRAAAASSARRSASASCSSAAAASSPRRELVFSGGHWKPYYRPHDHLPARKRYLAKLHRGREAS